jgi:hypothetical protein
VDVNDVVAELVEQARIRVEREKRRRQELAAARTAGLARRHAQKLRRLAEASVDNTSWAASGA